MASTLYDDLGVEPRSTPEDIRDAHRRMAKLLHPDYCQDDITRKLAEAHMKRVNAAFAVLSDAGRRRQYDIELQQSVRPAPRAPALVRPPRWTWLAAAAGLALFAFSMSRPTPVDAPSVETKPAAPVPALARTKAKPIPKPQPALPPKQREIAKLPPLPPPPISRREFVPPPAFSHASTPPLDPPPAIAAAPISLAEPRNTVAGAWIYLRPATETASKNSYPPEFIEMAVSEEGSRVKGRYSARYRVGDLAISPDVRFTFEGGLWKGNGGSEGEIDLKLLSPDRLLVNWVTTEAGPNLALGSGSAVLIRRRLP